MSAATPPPAAPASGSRSETAQALRVALAATLCLVVVAAWRLPHGNLAVWTTHMVMSQYTFSIFQKGVERIVGRGLGIVAGLVVVALFRDAPAVALLVESVLLLAFFYVYFAGRLAYTFLNAGLYLGAIIEIAHADPASAVPAGKELFVAIVLGVVVADLVTWLTGREGDLHIETGGDPLWPLRGDRLSHSLMLVVTTVLTQLTTRWLQLPSEASLVSVMVLTVTPGIQALLQKGALRVVGALWGTAWAGASFLLLNRLPHLPLLLVLLFGGMFVASYLTRTGGAHSYAGLQMGLVLPTLLVVPAREVGRITPALQRLEGVGAALAASILVGALWPPTSPPPSPPADKSAAPAGAQR
jgi:uncharacterized membrane protein YccC